METIKIVANQYKNQNAVEELKNFTPQKIEQVMKLHASMPHYQATPLHEMRALSNYLGVESIFVKDESTRFGLDSFKGIGTSYAMIAYFADRYALDLKTMDFKQIKKFIKTVPKLTFATATEGNHGKGVAWAAKLLGQHAKVFMPKGAADSRLKSIQKLGAESFVTELNYDDTVLKVAELAKRNGWILLQDTAWEGYEKVPLSIMQGYTSIIVEVMNQLENISLKEITHVFLQAGVGSFAASIAAVINNFTSGLSPKIIIVEPSEADCFYKSAENKSGAPIRVYGDLDTMMAGLSCGEPSPIAWNILKQLSSHFLSCPDSISAKGMRILGNPLNDDPRIISCASGSLPLGVVYELLTNEKLNHIKEELDLHSYSKILVINTEGKTDPINYQKVVWD